MGCGRVGSTLARTPREARPHRRRHRPATPTPSAGSAPTSRAHGHRRRLRPRHPARGRHRAGRRLRRGVQRRQLQHHRRPGRPRDLRRRERRRPHLRPAAAPRSTSGSASPPSPPSAGPPTRCSAGCCPTARRAEWRDPTGTVALAEVARRPSLGRPPRHRLEAASRAPGRVPHPARRGHAARRRHRPPGRRPACTSLIDRRRRRDERRRPSSPPARRSALMRVAIAGAGNVGRSIARELLDNGHEVLLIDTDPRAIKPDSVPGAEWLLADACELAVARGGRPADVPRGGRRDRRRQGQPRRVAAGQDRVRRPARRRRGSTTRRTSGCSTRPGASTSRSRPRGCCPRSSRRPSRVGDLVRLFTFRQGDANLVELTLPADRTARRPRVGDVQLAAPTPRSSRSSATPGSIAPSPDDRSRPATSCCSSPSPDAGAVARRTCSASRPPAVPARCRSAAAARLSAATLRGRAAR